MVGGRMIYKTNEFVQDGNSDTSTYTSMTYIIDVTYPGEYYPWMLLGSESRHGVALSLSILTQRFVFSHEALEWLGQDT